MNWRRLFAPTRPVGRRRRGATSSTTVPRSAPRRAASRGRPERGAKPVKAVPTPRRHRRRIPWTRITALAISFALVTILASLVAGPWLQVRTVTYDGARWTSRANLDRVMGPVVGRSALVVDSASLALAISNLPAIETADVEVGAFGEVRVAVVEGGAVAMWRTNAAQLLLAEDGTVVGVQSLDAERRGTLAGLPVIEDLRDTSHDLTVGDTILASELEAALALAALPASRLGSQGTLLSVALDPIYGFVISSPQVGWRAAFGFYGLDPTDTPDTMAARIASQASAVRTLFASHPETGVAWVDARNPGRVYFRARG
jgi:hypothetical protein